MPHILSKSRFIRGLQCEKAMFLDTYHKELAVIPPALRMKFDQGREFERSYKDTFPMGIDVSEMLGRQVDQYPSVTASLLAREGEVVLFEAGFQYQGVLVLADVVHKHADGTIEVMEVKNVSEVKEVIKNDVYVQHYVISHSVEGLKSFSVVYRNEQEDEPFQYMDLMNEAKAQWDFISEKILRFTNTLASKNEPVILMGDHCYTPYECPYKDYCSKPKSIQLALDF